jgi:type IV pilus assembly protein PilO
MSTAAVMPPPNSSSLMRHVPRLTARARALLTAMNLHFAGVAALAVITLYLAIHLFLTWNGLKANDAEALAAQHQRLVAAEIAARPLRGIDAKVAKSTDDADQFYADRLPYATSQVAAELGRLTHQQNVRLTRVQYAYAPVLTGDDELTEVRMDAGVSGDYRPVVQFVNALERDPMFFVINGINLTGQQTGQVNLRIRLTTFLREPDADEMAHGAALTPAEGDAAAPTGGAQ